MTPDIEPNTERNYPWIPEAPSQPMSEVLDQDSDSEDRPVYALSRTGAHELQAFDGDALSRGERIGDGIENLGMAIGAVGLPIIGGWQGLGLLDEITNFFLFVALILGVGALVPIGLFLGFVPGAFIKERAEVRRLKREEAHLRVGENEALSKIAVMLTENATGTGDVLWDMWEDLTELADEAAAARQDAGPAQLTVYNDNIAAMANRIERVIEQRQASEVDAQEALVELESHSDTEMAALLAERLTQKNQMWDRLAPIDNKEQDR